MILINKILGNTEQDPIWRERLKSCSVDVIRLTQWEAQKSHLRKTTHNGDDLGISISRNQMLTNGDVLLWNEEQKSIVIVAIELREVLSINTNPLLTQSPSNIAEIAFNLGLALGNQHWKAVYKNNQVFVPVTVDKKVMLTVLQSHKFDFSYSFIKGEEVLPQLTHSEARLLFGGAENSETHIHVHHSHGTH